MVAWRPKLSRRTWLASGAAAAAVAAFPLGRWLTASDRFEVRDGPYGRLRPDPDGVLDLLEGFRYRIVDRTGRRMSDGLPVPARPDGMACFEGPGGAWILMRNHEMPRGLRAQLMGGTTASPHAYDPDAAGGVTRLVLDPATLAIRSSNTVLTGTSLNCSGGPSPWGWLSGEEDAGGTHGYVFACDPSASATAAPVRVEAFGRFKHEAAAVHPESHVVYLTEDQTDGCLYRFVPHDPSVPFEGRLQAMRVRGRASEDSAPWRAGTRREIEWVDLRDPTPAQDDLRHTAQRLGAARVKRGEGACFAEGALYVCATTGGPIDRGQILRVEDGADGGELTVVAASTSPAVMDMPDNIVMSPTGTLYFVEDGQGHDSVRGVRADGLVFDLGRNAASEGEIAGACFSPDGRVLFVNLQNEGLTIAISGPFV